MLPMITLNEHGYPDLSSVIDVAPFTYEKRLLRQAASDPDLYDVVRKRQERAPSLQPMKSSPWNKKNPWENYHAADVADYLSRRTDLNLWYHIPNERHGAKQRAQLGMMGVRAGVPDYAVDHDFTLRFPLPADDDIEACSLLTFKGLKVELKRLKGGTVATAQMVWLKSYREAGYIAEVCRGASQMIALIEFCYGKGWLR